MLRTKQQQAFFELAIGKIIHIQSTSSEKWVKVRIDQLSWYLTKCIYTGTVVDASNATMLGQKYVGTVKQVTMQLQATGSLEPLNLSESDLDYLLQPWDEHNPTTNHEKRVNPEFLSSLTS